MTEAEPTSTVRAFHAGRKPRRFVPLLSVALAALAALALAINVRYIRGGAVREHIRRGAALADSGRPREAEKEWRAALRLDPSQIEPYMFLSRLYLGVDRPDLAIPLLERLRQIAPREPHTLCRLAEAYTRTGSTRKGLDTARQAVIVEPDCARAHALLGIYLGGVDEDTRGALRELSKALALAPKDDKIAISYAQAQLDANDFDGAERTARSVLARNPGYATAWYTLGRACSRRDPTPENLKAAIDAYQRATQLNPLFGDAFSEIGRLRVMAGDYKGAVTALEYTWSRGVRSKEIAYNLATAYRKLGDDSRADKMAAEFKRLSDFSTQYEALQKHLSVDPNNTDVALRLAKLDMESGNITDALPLVQGVLQRRPRDPRVLTTAASLYERLHQPRMANAFRQRLTVVQKEKEVQSAP